MDRSPDSLSMREREERLRLALDAGGMGTWAMNVVTGELVWDQKQCELFGLTQDNYPKHIEGILAMIAVDDRTTVQESIDRARLELEPISIEFRVHWPTGSLRWLAAHGRPIQRTEGTHLIGVAWDVTERKAAEQRQHEWQQELERVVAERTDQLRVSQERLQSIFNATADGIVTIDRQGIIIDVNPGTCRLFGYAEPELLGKNVNLLMPAPFRDEHDSYLARYHRTRESRVIGRDREVLAQRKDETTFPIEVTVTEVDHMGVFMGVIRDISERLELERQVVEVASDEQRRIGQELHDGVGQQLTGLSLYAGSLEEMADRLTREVNSGEGIAQRRLIDECQRIRELTQRMCRGLKETARDVQILSRGVMPVQLDVEGLVSSLTELASSVNGLEGVSCTFECPSRPKLEDTHSATHLYRIAQEGVHNAIKHSHAKDIIVRLEQDRGLVVLTIRDNGIGIDASREKKGISRGAGVRIMQYRANLIGASFQISELATGGTLIKCLLEPERLSRHVRFYQARAHLDC